MFKRAWLITVVPPNWIISCGLFSEILEVLGLNFHFIIMMSLFWYRHWWLKMYEFCAKMHLRLSLSALRVPVVVKHLSDYNILYQKC